MRQLTAKDSEYSLTRECGKYTRKATQIIENLKDLWFKSKSLNGV